MGLEYLIGGRVSSQALERIAAHTSSIGAGPACAGLSFSCPSTLVKFSLSTRIPRSPASNRSALAASIFAGMPAGSRNAGAFC